MAAQAESESYQENNEDHKENDKRNLPVDRGWAWVILLACFCKLFLIVGTLKSFGLFYVEFLREYNTTASMVSLVLSIQTAVFSFAAFFVLTLGSRYFSSRQLIMVGGTVAALGYLLNAFAPTVTFLMFSQGIVHASGCAATYGPALVVLSTYFQKRRGLANSLANVGGSCGSLLIPLLIRYLIDTYELQGALIIMSALLFHLTAAGALMRPFPGTPINDATENEHDLNITVLSDDDVKNKNGSMKNFQTSVNEAGEEESSKMFIQIHKQVSIQSDYSVDSKTGVKNTGSTRSVDKILEQLTGSTLDLYGSMCSIPNAIPVVNLQNSEIVQVSNTDEKHLFCVCGAKCCGGLFNCEILKNHSFQLLMAIGFLCIFGSALTITFIPPFAKDYNIPDDKIALLITISAVCDFMGRFSVAWVADSGVIKRTHLVGICIAISGTAAMLNTFYIDFHTFVVYAVIYGLVGGVYFSLYPVLIIEAVGQENLSNGLAIFFQVHGVSLMLNSFIIGYLRDMTGSYHASFYLMGTGLLLGTVCLFCEPLARKFEDKRKKEMIAEK